MFLRPYIFCVLLLSLLLASCRVPEQTNSLQAILESGVLKVGTNYGLTTYYYGAQGAQGFEFELASGFAEYLGVKLEVYPFYTLTELFPQLEQQRIDLIASGITVTPNRKKRFRFGPAYQHVSQKVVFKQGNVRPRKLQDLKGELVVLANSSHVETLQNLVSEQSDLSWQETDTKDSEELLEMIISGELDYTIADSNILSILRRRHPELSIGFTIQQDQGVAWAVNAANDDALFAALIEYFGVIRTNGRLAALEDKYFGHVDTFNYVDTKAFIRAVEITLPQYRDWFQLYAQDIDWRLLAAMSYQESHWDPEARSPTGVRGMMMLTRATAKDMGVISRIDAEESIKGGSRYFNKLFKRIPERIPSPDRLWFALAAYNVGMGHLEDARILTQKQGANPDLWVDVKQRLPLLRQRQYYRQTRFGYARGNEAVYYVDNIRRYYDTLVWLESREEEPSENLTESSEIAPE
jgi:membrane-bound lytic murein transglycosylase F